MCTRLGEVRFSHTLSNSFFPSHIRRFEGLFPVLGLPFPGSQTPAAHFANPLLTPAENSFTSEVCRNNLGSKNPPSPLQITHQVVQEESVLIAYILDNESGMPFFLVWPWQGHVLREPGGEHTPLHTHGRRVSVFPARARFLTQQNFR